MGIFDIKFRLFVCFSQAPEPMLQQALLRLATEVLFLMLLWLDLKCMAPLQRNTYNEIIIASGLFASFFSFLSQTAKLWETPVCNHRRHPAGTGKFSVHNLAHNLKNKSFSPNCLFMKLNI